MSFVRNDRERLEDIWGAIAQLILAESFKFFPTVLPSGDVKFEDSSFGSLEKF